MESEKGNKGNKCIHRPNTRMKIKYTTGIHDLRSSENYTITRMACDENPICHAELKKFTGCESFMKPLEPKIKANTNREES